MEVYYALSECKKRGDVNLFLHMKGLKELPAEVFELIQLQTLQLSNNKLTELPRQLTSLTNLTVLNLKQNKLTDAPGPAFLKLRVLDLSGNRISEMNQNFWDSLHSTLEVLSVANNKIVALPPLASALNTTLQNLSLRGNRITALPPSITYFQGLQNLDLSCNSLASLPDDLGILTCLTDLRASRNNITNFPFKPSSSTHNASTFAALKRLELKNHNLINSISSDVGLLSSLVHLNLTRNRIKDLPAELWYLPSLHILKASKNHIESLSIPTDTERSGLPLGPALVHLSLASNNLAELPRELGKITSLAKLYVSRNTLTVIPDEIGANLTNLQELILAENCLTELPTNLAELPSLLVLDASRNRLVKIPKGIKQLRSRCGGHLSVSLPDKVRDGLYIGCVHSADNFDFLRLKKISCIIRVMSDGEHNKPDIPEDFNFLWIQAHDNHGQNLMDYHFDRCYAFIEDALSQGQKILVHWSATVVVAYLMKKEGLPRDQALARVREKRPQVLPNHAFMRQLAKFEQQLLTETLVP